MDDRNAHRSGYTTQKREVIFGLLTLIFGILTANSVLFAGFYLGFTIFAGLALLSGIAYLLTRGGKLRGYSGSLLALSLVIIASFARSDDGFVKFVMFCFLLVSTNLGLCLLARRNRYASSGIASLLDVFRTIFIRPFRGVGRAFRGLSQFFRQSGRAGKVSGAVAVGLLVALPLVAILVPLLISADAAFDGLVSLLPDINFTELLVSLLLGSGVGLFLYLRNTALIHGRNTRVSKKTPPRGFYPLTVHTVLCVVSAVYLVYLVSQLAYFSGGFSGILPQAYTMAEYARRGFFEMAWICAINLTVISTAVGLVEKTQGKTPLLTRLLCLFIGLVTLFLVVSASAKMWMYIQSFGLTRLRVLTEVIMVFLGIATAIISLWLFLPKLPYMKAILLVALVMGATVAWADVDTQVARYNVTAYQSGRLETVDVNHLRQLGNGAVPYIAQLVDDENPEIAEKALLGLHSRDINKDFRDWHHTGSLASRYIINSLDPPGGLTRFNWSYTLPNGYAIWSLTSRQVLCVRQEANGQTFQQVSPLYVAYFCYDGQYVGLQCVEVPENKRESIDLSDPAYYLLDTATGQLSEPMTKEEFPLQTEDWIYTRQDPANIGW